MYEDMNLLKSLRCIGFKKEEIILLLKISESTYDKVISPNVERKLPKKAKKRLYEISKTNSSEDLIEVIKREQHHLKGRVEFIKLMDEKGHEHFKKNQRLVLSVLKSDKIQNLDKDKFKILEKFIQDDRQLEFLLNLVYSLYIKKENKKLTPEEEQLYILGCLECLKNTRKRKEIISIGEKIESEEKYVK